MNCEHCQHDHDGSYGSGRFCNIKCARAFSTKYKRKEINARVSQTLTKPPITKDCVVCFKTFETKIKRQICCSKRCSAQRSGDGNVRKFKREIERRRNEGPGTGNYVKSPQNIFELSPRTISKILKRLDIGCSRCGWKEASCDIHHIEGRKIPNPDNHSNLTYICPNCHRLFHRGKISRADVLTLDEQVGEKWKDFYFSTASMV